MEELRKSVQAAEKNRQAAMRALVEERQRSLELQVKISRQVLNSYVQFINFSHFKAQLYVLLCEWFSSLMLLCETAFEELTQFC